LGAHACTHLTLPQEAPTLRSPACACVCVRVCVCACVWGVRVCVRMCVRVRGVCVCACVRVYGVCVCACLWGMRMCVCACLWGVCACALVRVCVCACVWRVRMCVCGVCVCACVRVCVCVRVFLGHGQATPVFHPAVLSDLGGVIERKEDPEMAKFPKRRCVCFCVCACACVLARVCAGLGPCSSRLTFGPWQSPGRAALQGHLAVLCGRSSSSQRAFAPMSLSVVFIACPPPLSGSGCVCFCVFVLSPPPPA
jgi:hypothetical protein